MKFTDISQSEDQIHSQSTIWAWNTYPEFRLFWWHVPNQGKKNIIEARKLKTMGVKAGVWDIHIFYQFQFHILEFKTNFGTLSPQQKEWGEKMVNQGAYKHICRSLDEFQAAFKYIFRV